MADPGGRGRIPATHLAEESSRAVDVSTADELAKPQQLKDAGTINQAEYDSLKAKSIAS